MALLTSDVEPLWIAHYDYRRGSSLPMHAHRDYFQLIAITSSGGEALVEGSHFPLRTGQLYFLRPGLSHGLEAGAQAPVHTLDTKFRIHHRGLRQACQRLDPAHLEPDRRIIPLLEAIYHEAQQARAFSADLCRTLLTQVLLLMLRPEPGKNQIDLPVAEEEDSGADLSHGVHRYLRSHCEDEITQRTLSRTFHYSYHQLHSLYRKRYGESPLRALKRIRVERAMQLIRYSDYELKQIAERTGFATIHHFTRVFTALAGSSPARWRDHASRENRRDVVIHPGFVNQYLVRARAV